MMTLKAIKGKGAKMAMVAYRGKQVFIPVYVYRNFVTGEQEMSMTRSALSDKEIDKFSTLTKEFLSINLKDFDSLSLTDLKN